MIIFWFLVTPIRRKSRLFGLVALDYSCILVFYFLLAFTAIFAFDELNDLYTLNFQPTPGEPWYKLVVHYFLSLFPVFTLSTSFPIIAITLRNNLKALFLTEGRMYSWCTRQCVFPLLAIIPPVAGNFVIFVYHIYNFISKIVFLANEKDRLKNIFYCSGVCYNWPGVSCWHHW